VGSLRWESLFGGWFGAVAGCGVMCESVGRRGRWIGAPQHWWVAPGRLQISKGHLSQSWACMLASCSSMKGWHMVVFDVVDKGAAAGIGGAVEDRARV
jgi:hypothetical protein